MFAVLLTGALFILFPLCRVIIIILLEKKCSVLLHRLLFYPFVAARWNRALSATQNLKRKLTCYALVFVHELFYCVIGLVLNSEFFLSFLLSSAAVLSRNVISQFKLTRRCSIVVVVVVTCLLHGFPLRVIIIMHPPILEPYPSTVSICVCVCRLPV